MSKREKQDDQEAAKKASEEAAAADQAASKASPPDWQQPDYLGPLDTEQARWRNEHLGSFREPATKSEPGE